MGKKQQQTADELWRAAIVDTMKTMSDADFADAQPCVPLPDGKAHPRLTNAGAAPSPTPAGRLQRPQVVRLGTEPDDESTQFCLERGQASPGRR